MESLPLINLPGRTDPLWRSDTDISITSTGDFDRLLIMDRLTPVTDPPVGTASLCVI